MNSSITGLAIGLDIGGTKIASGVVSSDGEVVERLPSVSTPAADQEAILTELLRIVDSLRGRHPDVRAVGVGVAGMVDWPSGMVRWAPNAAFRRLPLRELIETKTGLRTIVDNDANAAAWAETRADKHSNMAFITVGTGIGGGLIIDGRLYRGPTGIAAEVGHLLVSPDGGERCGCGNIGCLEAMASGTALGRFALREASADPGGQLATLAGGADRVTGETVHAAARAGDPVAQRLFDQCGYWLGVGIASLVNILDLELVVIGGGLAETDELLFAPTRAAFDRFLFAPAHRKPPSLVGARLGAEAGWIGAGLLALDEPLPG